MHVLEGVRQHAAEEEKQVADRNELDQTKHELEKGVEEHFVGRTDDLEESAAVLAGSLSG